MKRVLWTLIAVASLAGAASHVADPRGTVENRIRALFNDAQPRNFDVAYGSDDSARFVAEKPANSIWLSVSDDGRKIYLCTNPGGDLSSALLDVTLPFINVYDYGFPFTSATINAAVQAGGDARTIYIPKGVWVCTGDLTFPSTVTVVFAHGAILVNKSYTVTFDGPVIASPTQFMSGAGTFDWNNGQPIYPEWFGGGTGATAAANGSAFNKSTEMAYQAGGGEVRLGAGTYTYDTTIQIRAHVSIIGQGRQLTKLSYTGSAWGIETKQDEGGTRYSLRGFYLSGTSSASGGIHLGTTTNPGGHYQGYFIVDDIEVDASFSGATASGLYLEDISHATVTHTMAKGGAYGLYFRASSVNSGVCVFDDCQFGYSEQDVTGGSTGCFLETISGPLADLTFNGCYFAGTAATSGLKLTGVASAVFNSPHIECSSNATYNSYITQHVEVTGGTASRVVFNAPYFGNGGTATVDYAIKVDDTQQPHTIIMNAVSAQNLLTAVWYIGSMTTSNQLYQMNGWSFITTTVALTNGSDGFVQFRQGHRVAAQANNDATPSVAGFSEFLVQDTDGGTTTITDLDDGYWGQIVTLIANDSNISIADGGNFQLVADWPSVAGRTLTLCYRAGVWYEVSRSDDVDPVWQTFRDDTLGTTFVFEPTAGFFGIGGTPKAGLHTLGGRSVVASSGGFLRATTYSDTTGGATVQGINEVDAGYDRAWFGSNARWDVTENLWKINNIGANDATGWLIPNGGGIKLIQQSTSGASFRTFTHTNFKAGAIWDIGTTGNVTAHGRHAIPADSSYVFGDPATDGSKRLIVVSDTLRFQERQSGAWVDLGTVP